MVQEHKLFKNIPLHVQGLNCGEGVYELEDHVGEETLSSNLLLELGSIKRIIRVSLSLSNDNEQNIGFTLIKRHKLLFYL
jgi:hypothetical protein